MGKKKATRWEVITSRKDLAKDMKAAVRKAEDPLDRELREIRERKGQPAKEDKHLVCWCKRILQPDPKWPINNCRDDMRYECDAPACRGLYIYDEAGRRYHNLVVTDYTARMEWSQKVIRAKLGQELGLKD